jgi:hypothetical protein
MAKGKFTGGGFRRGRPNKLKADVKGMILAALEGTGGQKWLEQQTNRNPAAFMRLLARLPPRRIRGDPAEPATGGRRGKLKVFA